MNLSIFGKLCLTNSYVAHGKTAISDISSIYFHAKAHYIIFGDPYFVEVTLKRQTQKLFAFFRETVIKLEHKRTSWLTDATLSTCHGKTTLALSIGGIVITRLKINHFPRFGVVVWHLMWICCLFKATSIDHHKKPYPRTQQHDKDAGWNQDHTIITVHAKTTPLPSRTHCEQVYKV